MFCTKCGSKLPDDAAFCGKCGAQQSGIDVQASSAQADSQTSGAQAGESAVAAKPKSGAGMKVAIAIGAAIVIIAAVFLVRMVACSGPPAEVKGSVESNSGSIGEQTGSVNAYSWDELSRISAEIAEASDENAALEVAKKYHLCKEDGTLDGTQTKDVTLPDGSVGQVQIVGFAHDNKRGGGKAGITFIFKDAVAEHNMNSEETNTGGWEASGMRSWLNSDFLEKLPDKDLRSAIVEVDKRTNNAGKAEDASSVTETSDKLWLLSSREICGDIDWYSGGNAKCNDVLNAEGEQYKLFRDTKINKDGKNNILAKSYGGKACNWWGRSSSSHAANGFRSVHSDGSPNHGGKASIVYAVVPGFCI